MDRAKQSAPELKARIDKTCNNIIVQYQRILFSAEDNASSDYATTAQTELAIETDTGALINSIQSLSKIIRELQELWLFGSLDTLSDPADEQANKEQALRVAALIEQLANAPPPTDKEVSNGMEDGVRPEPSTRRSIVLSLPSSKPGSNEQHSGLPLVRADDVNTLMRSSPPTASSPPLSDYSISPSSPPPPLSSRGIILGNRAFVPPSSTEPPRSSITPSLTTPGLTSGETPVEYDDEPISPHRYLS